MKKHLLIFTLVGTPFASSITRAAEEEGLSSFERSQSVLTVGPPEIRSFRALESRCTTSSQQEPFGFFLSLFCSDSDAVRRYIQQNSKIVSRKLLNKSPLHCAAVTGCLNSGGPEFSKKIQERYSVIEQLIRSGTPLDEQDEFGNTPLMYALKKHNRATTIVIESKPNVSLRNNKGQTALHVACLENNGDAILPLLELGAGLEDKDNQGDTPLLCAARYNKQYAVTKLIEHNVNLCAQDEKGYSTIDLTKSDKIKELIRGEYFLRLLSPYIHEDLANIVREFYNSYNEPRN